MVTVETTMNINCLCKETKDMGYGMLGKESTLDPTWVSTLKPAAQQYLRLWEDAIPLKVFDEQLMQAKLSGSAIGDILNRSPIRDRLVAIEGDAQANDDGKPDGPINIEDIDHDGDMSDTTHVTKMTMIMTGKIADEQGLLAKWCDYAGNTYKRHVKLFKEPGSSQGVCDLLTSVAVGQMKGTPGGAGPFVSCFYGCGQSGEASARPHLRIVAFREDHRGIGRTAARPEPDNKERR